MINLSLEDYAIKSDSMKSIISPKPVGYWRIGADEAGMFGNYMAVYKRPTDKQIQNHYKMLGWEFVEKFV